MVAGPGGSCLTGKNSSERDDSLRLHLWSKRSPNSRSGLDWKEYMCKKEAL